MRKLDSGAKGVQVRRGAILLWRLGNLKHGEQSRWDRAPESKGMWAFPWPYYDSFFTWHQYEYYMPKRLTTVPHTWWPRAREWYRVENEAYRELRPEEKLVIPDTEDVESDEPGYPYAVGPDGTHLALLASPDFTDARRAWMKNVGAKVLPLRKFWYEGDLYTHLDGEGMSTWRRIHSSSLAREIVKRRGSKGVDVGPHGLQTFNYSVDHLELFIPASAKGKITSPRPSHRD